MSRFRHEPQQYTDVAAIKAEVDVVNRKNDQIHVDELNRDYQWKEGSALAENLPYVIDQPGESANGRWVANTVATMHAATAVPLSDLDNGEGDFKDVTVSGVLLSRANIVTVKGTLPDLYYITDTRVIANNTVRITYENQTGDPVTGITVDVTVLEF